MAGLVRAFVSHHHSPEEDAFTARLVADLEAAGADVWVDDARIAANNFVQKISEGLEGRQWLVLVMTPKSVVSPWVRNEVNVALSEHTAGRMLGVIPVLAEPTPEHAIPMLWRPLLRYDATSAYEPARDGLLGALGLTTPAALPASFPLSESVADLLEHGEDLLAQKRYGDAISLFERATRLAPSNLYAWFNLGFSLSMTHNLSEALVAFERVSALDPTEVLAWDCRGTILCNLNRYEEGLAAYDRAVAINPNDAKTVGSRAYPLRALGRIAEADAAERRAKELSG